MQGHFIKKPKKRVLRAFKVIKWRCADCGELFDERKYALLCYELDRDINKMAEERTERASVVKR